MWLQAAATIIVLPLSIHSVTVRLWQNGKLQTRYTRYNIGVFRQKHKSEPNFLCYFSLYSTSSWSLDYPSVTVSSA